MVDLLLATSNPGKIREMRALLRDLNLVLVTPRELGLDLKVTEDGKTYAQNAAKKAVHFARAAGLLTLADDSGLEVDALDGLPGLRSARFAPWPNATDADRRAYLLAELGDKPRPWTAQFRCVVAIALPEGQIQYAEGMCLGEIIPEERGEEGFGYDPIFLLPSLGMTMAELNMTQKNRLSHRARAIHEARPILVKMLASQC
ncbi:MAG: RdgB/HAM1 family non-canonical purine NTP pyrophosphatase [Anaerolineales bacterium]|jgi:XTP/dITP diphosphohydrolase